MPFYVYITTTRSNTALYTGVTNDLVRRMAEHKLKVKDGFTKKYSVASWFITKSLKIQ